MCNAKRTIGNYTTCKIRSSFQSKLWEIDGYKRNKSNGSKKKKHKRDLPNCCMFGDNIRYKPSVYVFRLRKKSIVQVISLSIYETIKKEQP